MKSTNLLRVAQTHAQGAVNAGIGRPLQEELKRAVSTAYYALFLHLCETTANLMVGTLQPEPARRVAWQRMYRVLQHGSTRNKCRNRNEVQQFPDGMQEFAEILIQAQDARHDADYDPLSRYTRQQVLDIIAEAYRVISVFDATPRQERLHFIAYLLASDRNRRR